MENKELTKTHENYGEKDGLNFLFDWLFCNFGFVLRSFRELCCGFLLCFSLSFRSICRSNVRPDFDQILGQVFDQIFGQGFDQGLGEGRNHEHQLTNCWCELVPPMRLMRLMRPDLFRILLPLGFGPLSDLIPPQDRLLRPESNPRLTT